MKLRILGSGTCVPSLKRGGPASLVSVHEKNILVDSGTGTMHSLLRCGLTLHDIDIILYTHIHPDHTAELVPLLFANKYSESPRKKPLKLIGGREFSNFFDKLHGVYGKWLIPEQYNLEIIDLYEDELLIENIRIKSSKVAHIKESVAFRIEADGRSLVLSGDTGYCQEIINFSRNCDLLLLECSVPDETPVQGHLTPSEAAKIAIEAQCNKVVLTHFYPSCDIIDPVKIVKTMFKGEVIAGEDLAVIHV